MLRSSVVAIILAALFAPPAFAETATGAVRKANSLYSEGQYEEALKKYKAAQVELPADERVMFNLGNAQYKLKQYEEALSRYSNAAQVDDPKIRAQSHYNAGNALYRMGKLEGAVEQYLRALEYDPEDEDTKFNLEFVRQEIRRRMNEQQERQEKKQKEQEQKEDSKNKDSADRNDRQEQGKKEQRQDQQSREQQQADQQEKEQEKEQQQKRRPEQPEDSGASAGRSEGQTPQPVEHDKMSEENVQRWLNAIEAESEENMKEFLQKQHRGSAVPYPHDW